MATTHPQRQRPHHDAALYSIHSIPLTRPLLWLDRAWDDLLHHRGASLAYGVLVAVLGTVIMAYERHPIFLAAVSSAFLLVGPIMTAGICELSRCQDQGEEVSFQRSLLALAHRRKALLAFAAVLFSLALSWFALSTAILHGVTGAAAPSLESTVLGNVMAQLSRTQLQAYFLVGGVLAGVVFSLSVVTVPMIVDRHVSAATAMRMSIRATQRDLPAMLVWAGLIVALVAIGFATSMVGLVVVFPLLAHATWYAYQDLVD